MNVDFMGIGAQKAATSWLYKMLKQHPDLWLPPRKELHYFDRFLKYPSPSFLATDSYIERMNSTAEHNKLFRKKLEQDLSIDRRSQEIVTRTWYQQYYESDYDDTWYKSLFNEGDGKVKGEITPAYSILDQEDILHIKDLFPKLKIIFIMRDPVERAWSQIRFSMQRGKLDRLINFEELIQFIESPSLSSRGNYTRTLKNWGTHFHDTMFVGCYEDIKTDPIRFLNQIFIFLGVEPLAEKLNDIYKKIHISDTATIGINDQLKEYLLSKYMTQMEMLAKDYECAQKWLYTYRK
jgi:hypothetical protein